MAIVKSHVAEFAPATSPPSVAVASGGRHGILGPWPAHWPLTVLMLGFPLWWVLGLSAVMPLLLVVPMLVQLLQRHPIRVPSGFGWWLIFLVWVAVSVFMLWVDAPGAIPGGGLSRLLVFSHRFLWYLTCTVVLLWVYNLDERELPTERVTRLLGWMFTVTVAGGFLGILAPQLEITSIVEMVLPRSLTNNYFVHTMVHPTTAGVRSIVGEDLPRPVAPFAFANTWGSSLSMFLPFFLISWFGTSAKWRRFAAPIVLALATVPIVYSLNRGLWASLGIGAAFVIIRFALSGRLLHLLGAAMCMVVAAGVFFASPLADMSAERLDNPHSDQRREQLRWQTVSSTAEASPVLGFGSTRDVQGSFASIAGGPTPDCPGCGVPPLGTQGQLWLVVFSQGLLGAFFFLAFFAGQLRQHWRSRTRLQAAGVCLLLFFALQMLIYDTLGMPMYALMIALGLMWRERERMRTDVHESSNTAMRHSPSLEDLTRRIRRHILPIAALTIFGAGVGMFVASRHADSYTATNSVLLAPSPTYLDVTSATPPRQITVDTEAAMVFSERAVNEVREALPAVHSENLRDRIRVTAPANTRVINLHVTDDDPLRAAETVDALADAYLNVRGEYLAQRRDQVLQRLTEQLTAAPTIAETIDPADIFSTRSDDGLAGQGDEVVEVDDLDHLPVQVRIQEAIDAVRLVPTGAGELLRSSQVTQDRAQTEVPVASGGLLGLVVGLGMSAMRGGSWWPLRLRSRRKRGSEDLN